MTITISDAALEAMTQQERFNLAIGVLRSNGVKFRTNVRKCCRGCIMPSDLGYPKAADDSTDDPGAYAYTYGGQGQAVSWREGMPVLQSTKAPVPRIWINHGGGSAALVVKAFQDALLDVEWDGAESSTVVIHFIRTEAV